MLEGLVTWVLNNYVGEYLENLNADQLSIALLQGQVELENVPIKKTALRKFDVPLQVKSGIIGKLTLSIPMMKMKSEPWILKMSDLLVLLGPSDGSFDASDVEGYEQSKKEQLLEALEAHHKTQLSLNLGIPIKDEATQNQYWGASLVSAVSNNIQLILSNVHIRYEDSTTLPNNIPFNFGIRIQHISIQTTNSQWKAEFIQPSEGVNTFKKLDIKGFSVFWNCDQEVHKELLTHAELKSVLSPESSKENQFILQPFSMQARMEKNSSKFPLKTIPAIPRFKFDLRPEKINIELSKKQLAQIRVLTREWARFDRARQHRKWRPTVAVKENARIWWKFAINRIMDDTQRNRERCTLNFILTRAKHLNHYCKAYKLKLEAYIAEQHTPTSSSNTRRNSATKQSPSPTAAIEDIAFMKQIEHDSQYSYHELHIFRETIFRRLMREKDDERKGTTNSTDDEKSSAEPFEVVATPTIDMKKPNLGGELVAADGNNPEQASQGLYGWVASWFGSDKSNEDKQVEDDINEANFLQMWPNMQNKDLPPNLKKIERKVEEEILDVLNESWDDSTVLRRDNLLAEIVLRLERIIIRFIDDDPGSGSSRVIAMDWRQVTSRLQLSPREHRTEISLSVGDMNVHRLKIEPMDGEGDNEADIRDSFALDESLDEEDDNPSLLGFGSFPKFSPQLLFAIGRAKEDANDPEEAAYQHQENLILMTEQTQKTKKPLFQMIYRRMAPRINVLHELDAKFSSISVIYDEDAFNGISNLFDTEAALIEQTLDQANSDLGDLGDVGETHYYMNFSIPSVLFELRSRRTSLANKEMEEISSAFACAKLKNVDVGISKTEPMLTKLKIGLSSLIVDDLYEKNNPLPLIKTIENKKSLAESASLSNSCPDLHIEQQHFTTLSSSLPTKLEFKPVFIQKPPQLPLATRLPQKDKPIPTVIIDNDFGIHSPDGPILNFIFVDSEHPEYESKYAKRNCIVDAEFSHVDFAINRRTITLLFDFFGALGIKKEVIENAVDELLAGPFDEKDLKLLYGATENIPDIFKQDPSKTEMPQKTKKKKEDFLFHLKLAISAARIYMTYPKNQTQLGTILLNSAAFDLKINLKDVEQPMLLKILASELFIHDETPFYSRFYSERLALKSINDPSKKSLNENENRKLEIDIIKYRTDDPDLKRSCDMKVNMIIEEGCRLYYIHTHRFFCAIMDFWMHFAELQDQVRRTNENIGIPEEQQKMRTLIQIDMLGGASFILPLNQFSDQIILWDTSKISISNQFQLGSQTPELHEQSVENKIDTYNCLLEKMEIKLSAISIHEGYRISVDQEAAPEITKIFSRKVGNENLQNYYFAVSENGILTKKCDLDVNVYRNLSGLISHNTPDVVILTKFENIDLLFSTDFYCLLRGFLEKNLGESLIPIPDTIPIEILQNPDRGYTIETVEKYQTFSFRLTFVNVQFHFMVPQNCRFPQPGKYKKFGKMVLNKARISYDCYVDSLAEFDLICENTELIDTRFEDAKDGQNENSFPLILSSKEKLKPNDGNFMKLMSEIHIMMKKDEAPIVTLVLQNSRIIMILDWLNNAKDFFLLNTTFVPPEESAAQKNLYGFPKSGILTRTLSDPRPSPLHTITLKITLRDSDLILLEQTNNPSSLALVCFTTAVLNLNDQFGIIETNFEIQKLNCAWCIMSAEETTRCQISNDFTATLLVKRDILPVKEQAQALLIQHGLNESLPFKDFSPKQKIIIELGELVARASYKDMLVLTNVFNGSFERLKHSFENSMIPKLNLLPGKPPFNFQKIFFSADHISLWFLDDSQGVALPMLRLILSEIQIESHVGENLSSTFQANIDYFNQQIYGWEPFIEPWKIKHLNLIWKSDYLHLGLKSDPNTPLDINITQTLIQQVKHFHAKWLIHKRDLDRDFRNFCIRSRADHLPYLLKNEIGSNLLFTTDVEEITKARASQRKSNAKWFSVAQDKNCTFEFPIKRLISKEKSNDSRQLIVRVDGWDEISPVDVDSVGTYFRLTRITGSSSKRESIRARVVVEVTMDADGRKVVTIRSALLAINQLLDPIILRFSTPSSSTQGIEIPLESGGKLSIPLKFVNSQMFVRPSLKSTNLDGQAVDWRAAKLSGEIINQMLKYKVNSKEQFYWMCLSIKRENFPEYESLSGHTIVFVPPMSLTNLLPVEIEFTVETNIKQSYRIGPGDRFQLASVDLNNPLYLTIRTEQFKTTQPIMLNRSQFIDRTIQDDKRISFSMIDANSRALDMYGSVYISRGGSLQISLWVPFWIVNRSGIPLIIKQEATTTDAAGQFEEHEKAKDRNPLMFSFSNQNCPEQCVVRVGKYVEKDPEYKPQYCHKFALSSGVQALKLLLTHEFQATLMYDIGMEVRQCTGKYKNTQIVLFTPRYRLNNQSSTQLFVCHHEDVVRPSQHIPLASKCNLIWHESFEDKRRLCIRRADVAHWSYPFRIDQIGSFHITMRDRDETPKFVRVEVALSGASFWVTFSDAFYFPSPIKIENHSNVPVLYHQASKDYNRFRTICKANSTVDYFWDDLYGEKLLTLQVYENKSHNYDPSKPIRGPSLIYENYFYIQYTPSFNRARDKSDIETENHDLVMEARVNGKVVLNKLNLADSSQRQLWKIASDNSLENVGMNHTSKNNEKFVLDVLDTNDNALMVVCKNPKRNPTQKWRFTTEGTLACGVKDMVVEVVGRNKLILAKQKSNTVPLSQQFNIQRQKPGSGKLDVECMHVGPTLVVRISDHFDTALPLMLGTESGSNKKSRSSSPASSVLSQRRSRASMESSSNQYFNIDGEISPINIGISLVNNSAEELIYARFQGVQMHFCRVDKTYQITGHVNTIQADNQLLTTDRWQVLYCQVNALKGGDIDSPNNFDSLSNSSPNEFDLNFPVRPALKFELNCTPMEHYDAFDCFRVKLCDMCILLDETLLWKLVQFMHETGADVISKDSMAQPPNIEPDMNGSGSSISDGIPIRRCYFGTLDLEVGNVALTVMTVAKNGLTKDLQALKRQFNIKLVSFENALVSLPPFRQFHYFETMKFLVESLSKFYMMELQKQTINIVVTMDAFGNPRGLATDLKESFQGLVFEADITGFVYGLGYGVTNSLSKVASSMSHGVGSLTFDEQHELMRRRMMRIQPQSDNSSAAFSHFCNGIKGFGVGVYGGLTAIGGNISKTTKKDGLIAGVTKGLITGAVDTVTKPTQGLFDFLEGTASAVKEVVGSHSSKKSRFSDHRVRLPRVCTNLQSLLPVYSTKMAEAQQELLRINGYSTNEVLLDVEVILQHKTHDNIEQRVLICSEQCYCLRQINNSPASVTQRIPYRCFKNIYIDENTDVGKGFICIAVSYDTNQRSMPSPRIVCGDRDTGRRLCEKVLRAKQLYDHSKRTLSISDDFEYDTIQQI